ncbi:DUF1127 domain-containing protein [Pseudorhodobacter sp.]|uniref:DUF1127 domain-containing protein n=1 Tax=Pseudorhodobacter sp. TaxID=1934400 RepID=UPI002648F022|nr:DUF1127 domain-containing protein [Pseudorhodobacter sp.]MDN5786295.1 DUF1127 domain-containing protein [Pseudorhodobacter sp.]
MAFVTTSAPASQIAPRIGRFLARPFVAFWNLLILMAESTPRMEAVRALNAQSDGDLAARGTTRADEVRRIFGDRIH